MEDLLPEDVDNTVRYQLYLSKPPDDQLVDATKKLAIELSKGSIESFDLKVHAEENMCHGELKFDQNIEEEWLLIYILFKLSEKDQDLVIRVYDNDGEILLIEAADHLPHWLESSKSQSRIFIHKGNLHIIPEHIDLKSLGGDTSSSVTQKASRYIRDVNKGDQKNSTLASTAIRSAIDDQISEMPNKDAWLAKKFKLLDAIISGKI